MKGTDLAEHFKAALEGRAPGVPRVAGLDVEQRYIIRHHELAALVEAALAKPASSPAGVREAAELLSHLKLYVLEKLDPADADMLHDRMHDLTAALSQFTSAGRVGE